MSARFDVRPTALPGVVALARHRLGDDRGFLERLYCADDLAPILGGRRIAQANRTLTRSRGTLRGLHFQRPPRAETKLVACVRGAVFDVAVDVRRGSPTFLGWHAQVLSPETGETLVIPEGFAHGFQSLTDDVEMLYLHTAPHAPASEGGLNARDPRVAIPWPEPVALLSDRDAALPGADAFVPVDLHVGAPA
jgi:dTDP-4-dehydrorhamnose 3,5-epimerase